MRSSEQRANRAERTLKLQELLDSWRKRARKLSLSVIPGDAAASKILTKCADQLQELLDS